MSDTPDTTQLLRQAGLRTTPQRRAILSAFAGGASEHLSAEDVVSIVSATLPDISRATVYAALAEFAEVGLLASVGTPDPVRFEINTSRHQHFRCNLCQRMFDVHTPSPSADPYLALGRVRRINVIADGVCHDCEDYANGLRDGAADILAVSEPDVLPRGETSCIEMDSPIGPLLVAATSAGVARVAFEDQADVDQLRQIASSPARAGAEVLVQARDEINRYFTDGPITPRCPIDWAHIPAGRALKSVAEIPYGTSRSYHLLGSALAASALGLAAGTNSVPLLLPCHRIRRGSVLCDHYVGGTERRSWLLSHERSTMRL